MARILVVTSGHFCTSPRVWREADALTAAGHDVVVMGVAYDPAQAAMDAEMLRGRSWRYRAAADLTEAGVGPALARLGWRLRARAGRERLAMGWHDPEAFGYAVRRLRRAALAEPADLTILHLEPALEIGTHLVRQGRKIAVDLEDWYSENRALPFDHPEIRYLKTLEKAALQSAAYVTTPSRAMADALARAYSIRPPAVVYNSDPISIDALRPAPDGPLRLIWVSQTIAPGRGLEDLFRAFDLVQDDWRLELLGHCPAASRRWLSGALSPAWKDRVAVAPPVEPEALPARVSAHDVGLALDAPWCRNKKLTVSNKLLLSLQCGLHVGAAMTEGVWEIYCTMEKSVKTYTSGDHAALAALLTSFARQRSALRSKREEVRREAASGYGYGQQAEIIRESVERAVS